MFAKFDSVKTLKTLIKFSRSQIEGFDEWG